MSLLANLFVDGSYLYKGMKELACLPFNMGQLMDIIVKEVGARGDFGQGIGIQRGRIYYYNAPLNQSEDPEGYRKQQRFFASLKQQQIIIRLGELKDREKEFQCPHCGKKFVSEFKTEKGVDTRIAVDIMSLAARRAYGVAILVSGDGDFAPLAREARENWNVYFWNAHFRNRFTSYSEDLLKECDGYVILTKELADPARVNSL